MRVVEQEYAVKRERWGGSAQRGEGGVRSLYFGETQSELNKHRAVERENTVGLESAVGERALLE